MVLCVLSMSTAVTLLCPVGRILRYWQHSNCLDFDKHSMIWMHQRAVALKLLCGVRAAAARRKENTMHRLLLTCG